jgi:HlyD family secretion protein
MKAQPKLIARAVIGVLALSTVGYYAYSEVIGEVAEDSFYGSVDVRSVSVGFRVSGRVVEVLVDEGDRVTAGQILARLDAEPYRRMRDESLAVRDAAAARLAFLERGHTRDTVAKAAAQLEEFKAALENAKRIEARASELHRTGAVSQRTLDDAQTGRAEATARVRAAEHALADLRKGYREEEIAEARANLAHAEAAFARMQLQLDDAVLKAPDAGIVQTRAIEPGSFVNAGAVGLVLSKTDEAWVRAYVTEPQLGETVPGARVAVYTDSRTQPYEGRIGSVSPRAEFTPRNVETTDLRTSLVYRVRVLIDEPDDALRQGMPVSVRLSTEPRS